MQIGFTAHLSTVDEDKLISYGFYRHLKLRAACQKYPMKNSLLQPVLSEAHSKIALISSRALFFTAFFGGPVAIILLSALNSQRLKRLKHDFLLYGAGLIILVAAFFYFIDIPEGAQGWQWIGEYRRNHPIFRYGHRVLALAYWAVSYGLHRRFHKSMVLMDIEPLSPWIPAIVCVLVGGAVQLGIIMSVLAIRGVL